MFTRSVRMWSLIAGLSCTSAWVAVAKEGVAAEDKKADEVKADGAPQTVTTQSDLEAYFLLGKATPEQVVAWRKKFPFESLAPRLAYERERRPAPPASLSPVAEATLTKREEEQKVDSYGAVRAKSLEMLHTMEVEEFISKSGNGISRMPRPGAPYIEQPKPEPIDLVKLPPLSEEESKFAPTASLGGDEANAGAVAAARKLPARDEMLSFHSESLNSFTDPWSLGFMKSMDRVAGFQAHAFEHFPYAPLDGAKPEEPKFEWPGYDKRWQITRLELVSLLKHDAPRVYVTDHLPNMEELSSATTPTRDLDAFETASLKLLRDGEEIHTSSTPNRIAMLGAVRANTTCLRCHDVPRGALLGAFSYELRRDPPIKFTATPSIVQ